MKNIVLGVTGSIAAYKAADIANSLTKEGNSVYVVMTKAAREFITPLTFQTLTKNRVYTDIFSEDEPSRVCHIALAEQADLVLVAPASADIIAKASAGIADDLLSAVLLAAGNKPVVLRYSLPGHLLLRSHYVPAEIQKQVCQILQFLFLQLKYNALAHLLPEVSVNQIFSLPLFLPPIQSFLSPAASAHDRLCRNISPSQGTAMAVAENRCYIFVTVHTTGRVSNCIKAMYGP